MEGFGEHDRVGVSNLLHSSCRTKGLDQKSGRAVRYGRTCLSVAWSVRSLSPSRLRNVSAQLEAGIADGSSASYGAVSCAEATKNPILLAKALMDHGPHTMLVGSAADEKAKELGLEVVANSYFTTPFRKAYWERLSHSAQRDIGSEIGTVGAIVLDSYGHLAAGGSTGGPTRKIDGRVGDTAILGAGLYADERLSVLWYVPCMALPFETKERR